MKKFWRNTIVIIATAVVTGAIAFVLFGAPSQAVAQPTAPPPAGGSAAPAAGAPVVDSEFALLEKRPIDEDGTFWLPKAVNLEADSTDQMFVAVMALSVFFFLAITAAVVYFIVKYRHRPGHKPEPSAAHNDALEITWTIIPTIICVFLFYYGWRTYVKVVTPPNKALEISVVASKWNWEFTHQNGGKDSNLHVPKDVPVRLVMTSTDVLHAFYAPVLRVKQDIIPRRYTYAWFLATKPGTYRLTCAEYCGTNHSQMACKKFDEASGACLERAVVVVHEDEATYRRYLDSIAPIAGADPVLLGKKLYERNCVSCHTVDGSPRIGPSFKGSWGTPRKLTDGSEVTMDENYVRESLENPNAKIRQGFPASMTPFTGKFKEAELAGIIEYLKSVK
jgi:cytochrome c oxidase subunit II